MRDSLLLLAQVALMLRPPQDLPPSRWLMRMATAAYLLFGTWLLSDRLGVMTAFLMSATDALLLAGFAAFILALQGRLNRLLQTWTALAGAGALVSIVMLPLVAVISSLVGSGEGGVSSFLVYLLFSWLLAVNAHIFRHAFGLSNIFLGLAAAVIQYLFSEVMLAILFSSQLEALT
ncbi:MAG: hypothetical protein D6717_01495 [Gammaproteobacteria bacterium]|nr:MAG: hypothetical protein D6717_01495 [Gammaproteobacteria bacterium]